MTDDSTRRLAVAVASVLALDAGLHLYWTTGATWPANDSRGLSMAVLNADVPFTPPVLLPLVALLLGAAGTVIARSRVNRLTGSPHCSRPGRSRLPLGSRCVVRQAWSGSRGSASSAATRSLRVPGQAAIVPVGAARAAVRSRDRLPRLV